MGPSPSWEHELGLLLGAKSDLLDRLHRHWLEAQISLTTGPKAEQADASLIEAHAVIEQIRLLDAEIERLETDAAAQSTTNAPDDPGGIAALRASIRRRLSHLERLHGALDKAAIERLTALGKELSSLREGRGAIDSYRPFRPGSGRVDRNA